ncbi:MAG: helix-turn-helix domain-containing protein [Pseudomonadota bacterium]
MELLDTVGLEQRFGIKKRTAEKYRVSGDGPTFIKIGARVYYDPVDVEAWLTSRKRHSTSDQAQPCACSGRCGGRRE